MPDVQGLEAAPERESMSETWSSASTDQGGKAAVGAQGKFDEPVSEGAARQRILWVTFAFLLALALAVLLLRLQCLDELPSGVHHDEATHGMDALRVLQGEHAVFFPRILGAKG